MSRPSSFWHDPSPSAYVQSGTSSRNASTDHWPQARAAGQSPLDEPDASRRGRLEHDPSDDRDGEELGAPPAQSGEPAGTTAPTDPLQPPSKGQTLGRAVENPMESAQARAVWQKALGELQLQLAPSTYSTWLHDTWVEAYEDGEYVVGTPNTYARDWLHNRLRALVRKTLKGIVGRTVDVRFIVKAREVQDAVNARPVPLYAPLTESGEDREGAALPAPAAQPGSAIAVQIWERRAADDPAARRASRHALLNKGYTFDSYIVGNNNRFACAAAQAIAERPGYRFNPLFVHGGVGLGKTHLLHAIGNALEERGHQVLYCSSEQFTNDLISAIRSQNTEKFRNKYRDLDALLVDDIQFIAGKESTQEEFFHTFNHLQAIGKQIVMSSDRPPKALQSLEERLRSRFEGGIQVDVSAPDFETRVAILQSKAARMGILVGLDVLKLIAERVDSNIRELEGALNHLFLQSQMAHSALNLALASDTLDNVAPQRKPCSPPRLLELVAAHHGLNVDDLTGQRRTRPLADARHVAMYLLREDLALSLPVIGQWLGGRDHTTVAHAVDKITTELRSNEELRRRVAVLRERLYAPYAG